MKFDPRALTLDLWEKQDRRLALEKPPGAAEACSRFNTCLAQKGIAHFGITEVEGGAGLYFHRHPPCDRNRCGIQAKLFPFKNPLNSAFDFVLKSD